MSEIIPESITLSPGITRIDAAREVAWKLIDAPADIDIETNTTRRLAFYATSPFMVVAVAGATADDVAVCRVGAKSKRSWSLGWAKNLVPSWGAVKSVATAVTWLLMLAVIVWFFLGSPGPNPKPPGPVDPPTPAPIPASGLRVMVIHESTEGAALLTPKQVDELWGEEFQSFTRAKCAKGTDGKTPECLIVDKDVPLGKAVSEPMRAAFARPRTDVPWIIVSNGKTGFEGKLPNGGILDLVKRYAQ